MAVYNCDVCESNAAEVILGMVATGEQRFLCGRCYAVIALETVKTVLPPETIAQALGPLLIEGGLTVSEPKRGRGRKSERTEAQEPEPEPEPAAERLEEPEAAASD